MIDEMLCPHDKTHVEEVDYGYASYERQDWVEDYEMVEVCDTCGYQFPPVTSTLDEFDASGDR